MAGGPSDYVEIRSGDPAPPASSEDGGVRLYAAGDGSLRTVQSDGTDVAVGGGGSIWQGPFAVTHDTLPANGDFLHLVDLDPGDVMYDAYCIAGDAFGIDIEIGLAVSKRDDPGSSTQFGGGAFVMVDAGSSPGNYSVALRLSSSQAAPILIVGDCELVAYLNNGTLGGSGTMHVYALVGP